MPLSEASSSLVVGRLAGSSCPRSCRRPRRARRASAVDDRCRGRPGRCSGWPPSQMPSEQDGASTTQSDGDGRAAPHARGRRSCRRGKARGSNAQEAAQRDARCRAPRPRSHATSRIAISSGEVDRVRRGDQREVGRPAGRRPRPCRRRAAATASTPPSSADDHALDHERPADEPVGRADELHDLDLAAAGVEREPDRVGDQQHRGDARAAPRAAPS